MKGMAYIALLAVVGMTACKDKDKEPDEEEYEEMTEALTADQGVDVLGVNARIGADADRLRLVDITRAPQLIETGMVGIEIGLDADHAFVIQSVIDGMPAAYAGLEVGDQVIAIDDMATESMDLQTFLELVRGDAGTDVTISVIRDDIAQDFVIERETHVITQNFRELRHNLIADRDFAGVGVQLRRDAEGGVYVHRVLEGLPAEAAGLEAGDRISAIDGLSTEGATTIDYIAALRGEIGEHVELEVLDADGIARSVAIQRASMVLPEGGGCGR